MIEGPRASWTCSASITSSCLTCSPSRASRKHVQKYYGIADTGRFPAVATVNIKADVT